MVGGADARRALVSYIDARWVGSVGRFLNHSCEPNLEALTVRIGHLKPRVAFFATRDILKGEELTYDYGSPSEYFESPSDAARADLAPPETGPGSGDVGGSHADVAAGQPETRYGPPAPNNKLKDAGQPDAVGPTMAAQQLGTGTDGCSRLACLCGARRCRGFMPDLS
mmetsp:Transcript_18306/g.42621  ORF Transcript_18306/g.42621 Transcript_18306/m.42621 type:complete len:168 (-) Transcript_18306:75-578(-)